MDSIALKIARGNLVLDEGRVYTGGKAPKIDDPRISFYVGLFLKPCPRTNRRRTINSWSISTPIFTHRRFLFCERSSPPEKGTYIYFDEMNHVDHEPRAFDEFVAHPV